MNFSFYIAKRYLFNPSKTSAINIINGIAAFGIFVSAMALFIVLSVFSGLRDFSLSFSNQLQPDLKITSEIGKTISVTEIQFENIKQIEGIQFASKIIEEKALLFYNDKEVIATLKGVDSNYTNLTQLHKKLYMGNWLNPESPEVVIGYDIAYKLSIGVYDYTNVFQLYVPKPGKGTISSPEQAFQKTNVLPAGIYSINEDLDKQFIFCSIELAQELLNHTKEKISGIEIKLKPKANEKGITQKITQILSQKIDIKNKKQLNSDLYKMLNTENLAVYLIFSLVIVIALFNLTGALIMMILEKKSNLKTLNNIGVEINDLKKIFLYQGILLSTISGTLGIIAGISIVWIQQQYQLIMITPTMAYPINFEWINILIVFATTTLFGFLASKFASGVISKKNLY